MAQRTVTFASETVKDFVANHRRGSEYNSTIQNNTDQSITVTVTNQDIQSASPTFAPPSAGALVITSGSVGSLLDPHEGWRLTAGVAATGTVDIVEAG